jgi:hypothetical protein
VVHEPFLTRNQSPHCDEIGRKEQSVKPLISNPKDFGASLIYLGLGAAALWIGKDYSMGTTDRMGPGYFPFVLACVLILLGLIALVRSFVVVGEPIGGFAWKPLVLVLTATALFGFLINRAGLIISLLVLVLISAAASSKFRLEWRPALGLIALVVFCSLVFVTGLGVPMPLLGYWFGE